MKECKFCHTIPGNNERACQTFEETLHYFGCPWLTESQKVEVKFEAWLQCSPHAEVFRHGLDLADNMDVSLRRRVRDEIMSVARNHFTAGRLHDLREMVSSNG